MRICLLTHLFPRYEEDYKGIFVYELGESLVQRGHEVHVVTPMRPGTSQVESRGGITIHRFKHIGWRKGTRLGELRGIPIFFMGSFLVSGILQSIHVITQYHLELIHAYWVIPGGFIGIVAGSATKRPVVATAAGSDIHTASKGFTKLITTVTLARLSKVFSPGTDLGIRCVKLGANPKKVHVILGHAGIELDRFSPSEVAVNEESALSNKPHPILYIGNLSKPKRVDTIIRAMPRVVNELPEARLTIVGDGEEHQRLESLVSQLELESRVTFAGISPHELIPQWMKTAEIFVHCSDNEGLPVAIMEALACGKPIVASPVGGIPDLVKDGETGFLLEPDDVDGFAERMVTLLSNRQLVARMGNNARAFAEKHLARDVILEQIEAVYKEARGRGK